ncbi:OmpA/MotB domain protein [Magnetococcus marinus MC-1]|uniref:Peptidoglycan-associated lipoprotein n=1 Tax=Magnetococcus marinus (strain ATCC BAA-1437 / JCM 17883 / MC-1) TaxID=156889 RepID=A0L4U8_MAGMM|nr:peptidoglycan-associated lipoprotein Pal [Magnetococcus marinus]ABK42991.1 OmpA/MotB domain protein [Magnetococcus marinus MC-1]
MKRTGLFITATLLTVILTGCGGVPKDKPGDLRQEQMQDQYKGTTDEGQALTRPEGMAEEIGGGAGMDGSQYKSGSYYDEQSAAGSAGGTQDPMGQPENMIFFGYDSEALTYEAQTVLAQHAVAIIKGGVQSVSIEGHCDERGTREYNLALGQKRADSVKNFLNAQGVPTTVMRTVSYGKERPLYTGHTETSWARNRRAVLVYQ